jgi:hypothetical protein
MLDLLAQSIKMMLQNGGMSCGLRLQKKLMCQKRVWSKTKTIEKLAHFFDFNLPDEELSEK